MNGQPIQSATFAEVLGHHTDSGIEIEIALRKFDLPHEFAKAALAETRKLPDAVRPEDLKGRRDLRQLPFVTIDGETAKDFDDAVCARREGEGFRLWVAIADVSHYVRHGGALDTDARERGTSVYFPRREGTRAASRRRCSGIRGRRRAHRCALPRGRARRRAEHAPLCARLFA